jgi:hypothetical protein
MGHDDYRRAKMRGVLRVTFRPTPVGLVLETEQDKGVRMKSNHQARHLLGLNYKLSAEKSGAGRRCGNHG